MYHNEEYNCVSTSIRMHAYKGMREGAMCVCG